MKRVTTIKVTKGGTQDEVVRKEERLPIVPNMAGKDTEKYNGITNVGCDLETSMRSERDKASVAKIPKESPASPKQNVKESGPGSKPVDNNSPGIKKNVSHERNWSDIEKSNHSPHNQSKEGLPTKSPSAPVLLSDQLRTDDLGVKTVEKKSPSDARKVSGQHHSRSPSSAESKPAMPGQTNKTPLSGQALLVQEKNSRNDVPASPKHNSLPANIGRDILTDGYTATRQRHRASNEPKSPKSDGVISPKKSDSQSPDLKRSTSLSSKAQDWRNIIQAIFVRCLLAVSSFLCVWRAADVMENDLYWLLGLPTVFLLLETILILKFKKGKETVW